MKNIALGFLAAKSKRETWWVPGPRFLLMGHGPGEPGAPLTRAQRPSDADWGAPVGRAVRSSAAPPGRRRRGGNASRGTGASSGSGRFLGSLCGQRRHSDGPRGQSVGRV